VERCIQDYWWKNLSEIDPLEDLDVDGSVILKQIFKTLNGGINWIDLDQG
jgi:hypothetical protein